GGNGHRVGGLGAQDLAGRGDELGQHDGGGGGGGGVEVVAGGDEGAPQGRGEGEGGEPGLERLEPAAVVLGRHRVRRQQRLGGAHGEPQREQPVPFGAPRGCGDQRDQPFLGGRRGADHATRRSTAAATSAGAMSARQR